MPSCMSVDTSLPALLNEEKLKRLRISWHRGLVLPLPARPGWSDNWVNWLW